MDTFCIFTRLGKVTTIPRDLVARFRGCESQGREKKQKDKKKGTKGKKRRKLRK